MIESRISKASDIKRTLLTIKLDIEREIDSLSDVEAKAYYKSMLSLVDAQTNNMELINQRLDAVKNKK